MQKDHHFVTITDKNDRNTHKLIREKYDVILESDKDIINDDNDDNDDVLYYKTPQIYTKLRKYIDTLDITKTIPITISSDPTVSIATIASINEKFMIQLNDTQFSSNLRIIYFTDNPSFDGDFLNPDGVILSTLFMNMHDSEQLIPVNLSLTPNQLMLIGLNEQNYPDYVSDTLTKYNISHFTNERISKIGIDKLIYSMTNFISNSPVHVIFNLNVFSDNNFPSVIRKNSSNLISFNDLNQICNMLKYKNIAGLDIVGFNASYDDPKKRASQITAEYIRQLFSNILQIKEKKINIYTEDSQFLIYRSIEQLDYEHDIGWRILRDIPDELKEQLMSFVGSDIKTITIQNSDNNGEDEDIFVAVTSMAEQNQKSYYICNDIFDLCLMPEEKLAMMFEMVKDNE